MIIETFNLKNSAYRNYRNELAGMLKNRDVMPAKECIGRDFEILDAVVSAFEAQYILDAEGQVTNKAEIDSTKQEVSVLRISKREVPIKWTAQETLNAKFLIHDWNENPEPVAP